MIIKRACGGYNYFSNTFKDLPFTKYTEYKLPLQIFKILDSDLTP